GYQEQDASEQPATPQSPASHGVSSSSEGTPSDMRKAPRMSDVKKDKGELPAVAGAERRPASGSSARDSLRSPQGTSPPAPSVQSTMDQVEAKVNASTAGEWVNKLKALQDVADEHSSCACRIMGHVEDMFPEAREFSSSTKSKILDEIYLQLELSRELLERHAQGLIGTDLAELKMMKAEYKRLDDRLARMNKLFAKEVSSLRELLQKKKEGVVPTAPPKSSYEPLMFMEPAQRGWLLGLLEEKLEALLEANPDIERRVNTSELARLRDLFKKEQQSSLERKVAKLNEEDQAARKQIAVLEAYNEKLKLEIRKIDDSGSSTSTLVDGLAPDGSSSLVVVKQTSGSSAAMSPPAGKPKTGRPKRGATFTRAGSGEEVAAQAAPEFLQLPEGS
ncbi:Cdc40, partial [Symbiodinium sp. CCMP2456]